MGFLDGKHFVISAIVAVLLLAGGALSYNLAGRAWGAFGEDGCEPRVATGVPLAAQRREENGTDRRVISYSITTGAFEGGAVDLCLAVGDVRITNAAGDVAEVVFTIEGHGRAVAETRVDAAFAQEGGRLSLAAWEERVGVADAFFFGRDGADVLLEVRLPATGAYDLKAVTDVGSVHVTGLLAREVDLAADVGDVIATGIDATGNVTLTVDVGRIDAAFASLQTGTIAARADVGDVGIRLPQRADIGYSVHASADVGDVSVDVGPTERFVSEDDDPAGDDVEARSQGYDAKPTRVVVQAAADVGDVAVEAG